MFDVEHIIRKIASHQHKVLTKMNSIQDQDETPLQFYVNPIQDGGGGQKAPPYQFFPCNFYKRRN